MSQYLYQITVTVPAFTAIERQYAGQWFRCRSVPTAEDELEIAFGKAGEFNSVIGGRKFFIPGGFTLLKFRNRTAAPITLIAHVGTAEVTDDPSVITIAGIVETNAALQVADGNWVLATPATDPTPGTAIPFAGVATWAQRALIRVPAGNTGVISFGPDASADFVDGQHPGDEYLIQSPTGKRFNLALWHYKSTVGNEGIKIIYVS